MAVPADDLLMSFRRRLVGARTVLTMDASEALDRAVIPYLELFRRRPVAMHALGVGVVGGSFVLVWWLGGLKAALVCVALSLGLLTVAIAFDALRSALRRLT
jgi:hypothetical protein